MKNRTAYSIGGVVLVLSAAMQAAYQLVWLPAQAMTYQPTVWDTLTLYLARPAFWLSLGALAAGGCRRQMAYRRTFLWLGAALTVLYSILAVLQVSGVLLAKPLWIALLWLTQNPVVFLIPGILLGIGVHPSESVPMRGRRVLT